MLKNNWWLGGVLIVFGVMLFLNNLGVTDLDIGNIIGMYWPLLLLFWGLNIVLIKNRNGGNLLSGGILLVLGLVLLGRNTGYLTFNIAYFWKIFWPVILILMGVNMIRGPQAGGKNNVAFLGGIDRTKGNWKLESGDYWAFMGGVDLDLRRADLAEKDYLLNCTAVLGGIHIIVPPDLTVICEGRTVLGGIEFLGESSGGIVGASSAQQEGTGGTLINIYGRAFLGGIEVTTQR